MKTILITLVAILVSFAQAQPPSTEAVAMRAANHANGIMLLECPFSLAEPPTFPEETCFRLPYSSINLARLDIEYAAMLMDGAWGAPWSELVEDGAIGLARTYNMRGGAYMFLAMKMPEYDSVYVWVIRVQGD